MIEMRNVKGGQLWVLKNQSPGRRRESMIVVRSRPNRYGSYKCLFVSAPGPQMTSMTKNYINIFFELVAE